MENYLQLWVSAKPVHGHRRSISVHAEVYFLFASTLTDQCLGPSLHACFQSPCQLGLHLAASQITVYR